MTLEKLAPIPGIVRIAPLGDGAVRIAFPPPIVAGNVAAFIAFVRIKPILAPGIFLGGERIGISGADLPQIRLVRAPRQSEGRKTRQCQRRECVWLHSIASLIFLVLNPPNRRVILKR
jgi:hypothetical protein